MSGYARGRNNTSPVSACCRRDVDGAVLLKIRHWNAVFGGPVTTKLTSNESPAAVTVSCRRPSPCDHADVAVQFATTGKSAASVRTSAGFAHDATHPSE
jgi:hypothetical protein